MLYLPRFITSLRSTYPFIHPSIQYIFSVTYYLPGATVDTWDESVNKINKVPHFKAYVIVG